MTLAEALEVSRRPALGPGFEQYDINGDGRFTPVDALEIIRALNHQNASGGSAGDPWYDVNKDGAFDKQDALDAVEALNELFDRQNEWEEEMHEALEDILRGTNQK